MRRYSLDDSLGNLATLYSRAALRRLAQEFPKQGVSITAEQWLVLVQIWHENGLPQCTIAEKLSKDRAAFTRLVHELELRGFAVRVPGPTDGREKLLWLTEEGKRVMEQATLCAQGVLEQAQQGISDEELKVCKSVLRRARGNLT